MMYYVGVKYIWKCVSKGVAIGKIVKQREVIRWILECLRLSYGTG